MQLAAKGYVVSDTVETMFYAPDADVLMSSSFAATHCFKLVPAPRDRPGLIGVAFQPVRERENVHDITGTFWVDRATSELRSLEFRYTNLPPVVVAAVAGGDVEFLRLADGSWLVNRWSVRLPMLGVPERISERSARFSVNVTKATVGAIQVSGGQVTAVFRNDAPQYRASGPGLALQVVSRDSLLPAAGAMLALAGTDYVATADASGRFALSPVLEGHYRARVQSWLMDSLGLGPVERDIEVRADAHVDSLTLPTAREALVKMCPSDSVRHGEGMLRGSARDEHGRALPQAAVTVTWQRSFPDVGDQPTVHEETVGVLTDDAGLWRICGIPRGIALSARVVSDSGADFHSARLADDQAFGTVDLVARRGEEGTSAGPATTRAARRARGLWHRRRSALPARRSTLPYRAERHVP